MSAYFKPSGLYILRPKGSMAEPITSLLCVAIGRFPPYINQKRQNVKKKKKTITKHGTFYVKTLAIEYFILVKSYRLFYIQHSKNFYLRHCIFYFAETLVNMLLKDKYGNIQLSAMSSKVFPKTG